METLNKMVELIQEIVADSDKLVQKGTFSRGRSARLKISELHKMCKQARLEVLAAMKQSKERKDERKKSRKSE